MPDLPTISVTDNQYSRLANVLEGSTPAEKAASYRQVVRTALRNYVIEAEIRAARAAADISIQNAIDVAKTNPDNL